VEAGKLELNLAPVELPAFLADIADLFRGRAEAKQLEFGYQAAGLPRVVIADEKYVRQVLLNLLSNAIKFTDKGRVDFRATARAATDASAHGTVVRFEVQDTGIGIAPEHREQAFQPFHQFADLAYRRGGTGLGLAISRQLVRAMDGDIGFDSTPGRGSLFWFELRLAAAPAAAPAEAAADAMPTWRGPPLRVLVVDDVLENRALLRDMLQPLGFTVFEAESGRSGVEQAQAQRPDVILMDTVMPVMDGLAATRALRTLPGLERTPIITISASAGKLDEEAALAAGATAFLAKPFRAQELFALIEKHVGNLSG
jgi:CheY-like chemotaxis protein